MPKSLSVNNPLNIRLQRLNCDVRYNTQVEVERDPKTKRMVKDEDGKPENKPTLVRAHLIPRGGDGTPWLSATGSDKMLALEAVLDLAEKSDRPLMTVSALSKENEDLRRQIAEADRKAEKLDLELKARMAGSGAR